MTSSPEGVVRLLLSRLTDATLAAVISGLTAACGERPGCARLLAREQLSTISPPLLDGDTRVEVRGTDVLAGSWSLLFATPFYQAVLPDHESLDASLLDLLEAERRSQRTISGHGAASFAETKGVARSLVGNGWRTDDTFLQRRDAPIRRLHAFLFAQSQVVVQYGQPRPLDLKLRLDGWAVSMRAGGRQTEHVHPHASWSGVYYVQVPPRSSRGGKGGCLRVTDPRPGAMMVTLGRNDGQFIEAREICPQAGLLVMFPAWLSHGVNPIDDDGEGDEARVAVAFNVHGAEVERAR